MIERLKSPGFARTAVWASALVLIAGLVAFVTVRIGGDDAKPAAVPASTVDGTDFIPPTTTPKESDVPKEAREVAGEFILAAAGREDLERAWQIAHPDLKRDCGCTKKQWLTGNINVQYFPTAGLQGAGFTVNEVDAGSGRARGAPDPEAGQRGAAHGLLHRSEEGQGQVARGLLGAALGSPGPAAGLTSDPAVQGNFASSATAARTLGGVIVTPTFVTSDV